MPDLAIAAAIVAAVQKIYAAYQQIMSLLQGSPSVDDEILALVQTMTQQLNAIAQSIQQLQTEIERVLEGVELSAVNQNMQQAQLQAGDAQTAAEEYAEWVNNGKPDMGTFAVQSQPAWTTSLGAANNLRDTTEFFTKPSVGPSGETQNVFDYRLALAQYVYALSVRLTVFMGMEPAWASDDVILQELRLHVERLQQISAAMVQGIECAPTIFLPPDAPANAFGVNGFAKDSVSSYMTEVFRSPAIPGTAADATAYAQSLKSRLVTEVRNAIGVTTLDQLTSMVDWYANGAPNTGTWTPWTPIANVQATVTENLDAVWPLVAFGTAAGAMTAVWGTRGEVQATIRTEGADWGPPAAIPGSATAGESLSDHAGPRLVATTDSSGTAFVFWTAIDGSTHCSYYDPSATSPAWAPAFAALAAPIGFGAQGASLLGAASPHPGAATLFHLSTDQPSPSVMATTVALTKQSGGGQTTVTVSPPLATGASHDAQPGLFVALNCGPGSISIVYYAQNGIEATFLDERGTMPSWAKPFRVAPDSPTPAAIAAVSTVPYVIDVFWTDFQPASLDLATVSGSAFSLEVADDNPVGGLVHRTVTQTAPTTPSVVTPSVAQVASDGARLAALAAAPVAAGPAPAGATSLFWMTETQIVDTVWRSRASGWSDVTRIRAPLGTSTGPIVPIAAGPAEIAMLAIIPQTNNQGQSGDSTLAITQWRSGRLPERPRPAPAPVRRPAATEPHPSARDALAGERP